MDCKDLSIPKTSHISGSVLCDASRVLKRMSSPYDESSISGTVSISPFVGNPRLSLVAALRVCSNGGDASSMSRKAFVAESPKNLSFYVAIVRNLPIWCFKGTHLLQVSNCKIPVTFLVFFV